MWFGASGWVQGEGTLDDLVRLDRKSAGQRSGGWCAFGGAGLAEAPQQLGPRGRERLAESQEPRFRGRR